MRSVDSLREKINVTLDDIVFHVLCENFTQAVDCVTLLKIKVNRLERELKRLEEEEQ